MRIASRSSSRSPTVALTSSFTRAPVTSRIANGSRYEGSSRPSLNQRGWKKKAAWVKERDGHRCTECGETEGLVCHHIVRPQDGGTDESSNLTTLCRRCHGNAHLKRSEDRRVVFLEGATGHPSPVFREGQREKP
jgi:5-methylcytosine-specific restriction endonuclease McrA